MPVQTVMERPNETRDLGYPVYELWRWSGLMLIAPPDCTRYERHTIPKR